MPLQPSSGGATPQVELYHTPRMGQLVTTRHQYVTPMFSVSQWVKVGTRHPSPSRKKSTIQSADCSRIREKSPKE